MSKTDKTAPYWVRIIRREGNRKPFVDHHRHGGYSTWDKRGRTCDLGPPIPYSRGGNPYRGCEVWFAYSENDLFYGRRPKRSTRKAMGRDRALRHDLVRLRRLWLWQDREDIDSLENAPINHRYLYDPWDWD